MQRPWSEWSGSWLSPDWEHSFGPVALIEEPPHSGLEPLLIGIDLSVSEFADAVAGAACSRVIHLLGRQQTPLHSQQTLLCESLGETWLASSDPPSLRA